MDLRGWVRTSLIDDPDRIATVVFVGGCNFRCPMCHNADLVLRPGALAPIDPEEVWGWLRKRAGMVAGIVITGGEPTLQPDLPDFCRRARDAGLAVKLDTNGYRPDVLETLLGEGLLSAVAVDVKAPPSKVALLAGLSDVDLSRIERTLVALRGAGVRYELRTTVVPGLLDASDIAALAQWMAGAERYVLQQFRGASTLDPALAGRAPYPAEVLREMAAIAREWVPNTTIRGL